MTDALDATGVLRRRDDRAALHRKERISRRAGFVCYTAPPAILRAHGAIIHDLHGRPGCYLPLAEQAGNSCRSDGEFQLVPHFEDLVSAAVVARREILGEEDRRVTSDDERGAVWRRAAVALRRLRDARK